MRIYKRGDCYWYQFMHDGRTYRRTTGLTNRNDAKEFAITKRSELIKGEAGIYNEKPCPTLRQFCETEFEPRIKETIYYGVDGQIKPKTWNDFYRVGMGTLLASDLADLPLNKIKRSSLQSLPHSDVTKANK